MTLVYSPPEGCYGSPQQAIREAQVLIETLTRPENVASYFRDFDGASLGVMQCPPLGAVMVTMDENDGVLRITATECEEPAQ